MMLDNNFLLALISILLVIVLMVLRRLNARDDTRLVTELKVMQERSNGSSATCVMKSASLRGPGARNCNKA